MPDQRLIILCPGQGAQHLGMGKAWASMSNEAAKVYRHADEVLGPILGLDLSKVCFEGPEDTLNGTDIAQAAIYVTSIACLRGLEEQGKISLDNPGPAAVAGLSLGEYTALHLAGVFDFTDGLQLVAQRGRFMQEAAEASDSGMVALIGADEAQARQLCEAASAGAPGDVLVPANFNCPGQIVISGTSAACARALEEASRMGLRATALTVAGAFHSPLMQSAADRMEDALSRVPFEPPRTTVLSNVTGEPHGTDTDEIKRLLVRQITEPVRWEQNVRWLTANAPAAGPGPGRYIEPAPGKVLSGLMRRIDKSVKVENHAEP